MVINLKTAKALGLVVPTALLLLATTSSSLCSAARRRGRSLREGSSRSACDACPGPGSAGRYLVNVLGHYGECHTPRGIAGEMKLSRSLTRGSHSAGADAS